MLDTNHRFPHPRPVETLIRAGLDGQTSATPEHRFQSINESTGTGVTEVYDFAAIGAGPARESAAELAAFYGLRLPTGASQSRSRALNRCEIPTGHNSVRRRTRPYYGRTRHACRSR